MPIFIFHCDPCSQDLRKLLDAMPPADKPVLCPKCGQPVQRKPRGPGTRVVEVLDNGVMAKRLERLSDAERLYWERNKKPDQG